MFSGVGRIGGSGRWGQGRRSNIKAGERKDSERSGAAYSLGWTGDSRAVDPLIEALDDENWSVRARAANSLGNIGDSRAVGPLIETLDDSDSAVRFSAVGALGSIGDSRGSNL